MGEPLGFWDLLRCWLDENYSRYGIYKLNTTTTAAWENHWPNEDPDHNLGVLTCIPCMAYFELTYENNAFTVEKKIFCPADPNFKFEDVLSVKLNQHLYHHQKGPLYTEKWKLEKGAGVW